MQAKNTNEMARWQGVKWLDGWRTGENAISSQRGAERLYARYGDQ